jgi:curli biogenesis system outer membrane secretion channel CsgG
MKTIISIVFCGLIFSTTSNSVEPVALSKRISVTRFNQQVDHIPNYCHGWEFTEQNQLKTDLESELFKRGLNVLERESIRQIYSDEYELPNMDPSSTPKRGKFLSAQYTITGGIVELGICEESSGSGIQLGGIVSLLGGPASDLRVGKHSATSKVKLVARLVSTDTGQLLKSFEAQSEISDGGYSVEGGAMGIGASHKSKTELPIERASHRVIEDLSTQIAEYIKN